MHRDIRLRPPTAGEICASATRPSTGSVHSRVVASYANLPTRIGIGLLAATAVLSAQGCYSALQGCCPTWGLAYRTTIQEPAEFATHHDRKRSMELYSAWADQAWIEQTGSCSNSVFGNEYAAGFHDGFVDFVFGGGSGEPPPVPPRQFWNAALRNEEGKQRVEQWYQGYRHGARAARDGGYREMATIHSSTALPRREDRFDSAQRQTSPFVDDASSSMPDVETLPEMTAPAQDKHPAQPAPTAKPKDIPATSRPSASEKTPQEEKKTAPAIEPPPAPKDTEPKSEMPEAGVSPRRPTPIDRVTILPRSAAPSKPATRSTPHDVPRPIPAPPVAKVGGPETVVNSTVRFVRPSTPARSNTQSEVFAHKAETSDNHGRKTQSSAIVLRCSAEAPAQSQTAADVKNSPPADCRGATRSRATNDQLFRR